MSIGPTEPTVDSTLNNTEAMHDLARDLRWTDRVVVRICIHLRLKGTAYLMAWASNQESALLFASLQNLMSQAHYRRTYNQNWPAWPFYHPENNRSTAWPSVYLYKCRPAHLCYPAVPDILQRTTKIVQYFYNLVWLTAKQSSNNKTLRITHVNLYNFIVYLSVSTISLRKSWLEVSFNIASLCTPQKLFDFRD